MTGHEYKNASGMRGCIVLDVESSHTSVWRVCRERVGFDPNGHMDQNFSQRTALSFFFNVFFSIIRIHGITPPNECKKKAIFFLLTKIHKFSLRCAGLLSYRLVIVYIFTFHM